MANHSDSPALDLQNENAEVLDYLRAESRTFAMQEIVRQAMREGALGFSTSQIEIHVGEDGRPVPSNLASSEEILALV